MGLYRREAKAPAPAPQGGSAASLPPPEGLGRQTGNLWMQLVPPEGNSAGLLQLLKQTQQSTYICLRLFAVISCIYYGRTVA